jgi:hypothetical protein
MENAELNLTFKSDKSNSTHGYLTLSCGDQVLHSDKLDIAKHTQRSKFCAFAQGKHAAIDSNEIEELLLAEIGRVRSEPEKTDSAVEIDVSQVVRPQLFFTPEVCGVLVAGSKIVDNKPIGYWNLYLKWSDGRRQCLPFTDSLLLETEQRLWFDPQPLAPAICDVCQWSKQSRQKWLQGGAVSIEETLATLMKVFEHYLEFRGEEVKGHLAVLSLWTFLTYVYPIWPAVPYLSVGGPLGSGKSRVFDVLARVVFHPIVSSNMTAPCLFRTLNGQGGVLLLDEAERLKEKTPDVGELLSILLAGYKAGQKASRLEKVEDGFQPVKFDVYGPKALACINGIPPALLSRSIPITMFRASKGSDKPRRQLQGYGGWQSIRDCLYCFTLEYGHKLLEFLKQPVMCDGLYGRDLEIWTPILALARFFEAETSVKALVSIVEDHARYLVEDQQEDSVSATDEVVLKALARELKRFPHGVTASQVLNVARIEEPTLFNRYSARGISSILKRYSLKSTRNGGKNLFRPSDLELLNVQETYCVQLREP